LPSGLYTTIEFKYRIVVTLIGVFAVLAATRDCLFHLDAQPVGTSARNTWVLRAAGAG
jgi:hypothetical protein